MSESELSEQDLFELIQGACNATITQVEFDRLLSTMRDSSSARQLYLAYMLLDAELHWRKSGRASAAPETIGPSNGVKSANPLALPLPIDDAGGPLIGHMPTGLAGMDPVAFKRLSESSRSQIAGAGRTAPVRRRSAPSRWIDEVAYRLVGTFVFWIVLIIAVSPYLLSHFGNKTVKIPTAEPKLSESDGPRAAPSSEALATVMSMENCVWQDPLQSLTEGAAIGSQRLELQSGTVELMFNDGARVVVEGPAGLVLQASDRALLDYGKLAAQVPKRAVGFTVVTPTAEIVDFGTEFGVAVSKEGLVETAVLVGKVEVGGLESSPDRTAQRDQRKKRVVTAGQAVTARRDANRLAINSANFSEMMKTSLAKPFESLARLPARTTAYGVPDRTAGDQSNFYGGVGLDFEVKSPIRIFSLGVFDHLGDGIDMSTRPIVQLWLRHTNGTADPSDDIGQEMIASQIFMAGDSSELQQGHRLKPLSKAIELPVGSYSIVAYDLAGKNAFIGDLGDNLQSGSVIAPDDFVIKGQAGGAFVRNDNESYFGDTHLSHAFTLNSDISASGSFVFSSPNKAHDGKFFVGHFSQSTDNNRREFIGAEFARGDLPDSICVRARINRFNGATSDDAFSDYVYLPRPGSKYHFDYVYDPNYEADADHRGPEGRLALRIYDDGHTVDETLYAINHSTHRDVGSTFDAFGVGIGTSQAMFGDDPTAITTLFIDDVTYSGHEGVVGFNTDPGWAGVGNDRDGNNYGWVQPGDEELKKTVAPEQEKDAPIIAVGSRFGEGKPGTFPAKSFGKKIGFAAGTFEYVKRPIIRDGKGE